MKRGDVITRFDGVEIASMETLPKQVASIKPGKSVKVEVIREGKSRILDIKIEPMKEEKPA
jgi:serine protease Do